MSTGTRQISLDEDIDHLENGRRISMCVTPEVVFQLRQRADDGIMRVSLERELGGLFTCGMNTVTVWLLWHE
jgi:hypothetical protein